MPNELSSSGHAEQDRPPALNAAAYHPTAAQSHHALLVSEDSGSHAQTAGTEEQE
jgi:hypothetical protein